VLLKLRRKLSRFSKRFHIFTLLCFQSFCWLWNEPLITLPLAMKHAAWVFSGFQTQRGRNRFGAKTVRLGRARVVRVSGADTGLTRLVHTLSAQCLGEFL